MLTHQSMKLKDEDMKVVVLDNLWLINALLEHLHQQSTNYSILASQNLLYHLYHTILQHPQHPNFYFPILLIKIIFLHNKIIYPKIIITYNTTHYLLFLSHSFCSTTTATFIAFFSFSIKTFFNQILNQCCTALVNISLILLGSYIILMS